MSDCPIFSSEHFNLLLPLPTPVVPEWLSEKTLPLGLEPKHEYHFTIIGRKTGDQIKEILMELEQDRVQKILRRIEVLTEEYGWKVTPLEKYYSIERSYQNIDTLEWDETRRSIVEAIRVDDLLEFYRELNTLLGTDFLPPFEHVTLFSSSTRRDNMQRGIGIYSLQDWESLNPQELTP